MAAAASDEHVSLDSNPVSKRQKKNDLEEVTGVAWENFRNYLDSVQQQGEGDFDELQELLENLNPFLVHVNTDTKDDDSSVLELVQKYRSKKELLPVLCSVAHYHLADTAILQNVDQNDGNNVSTEAERHLMASIQCFRYNAAAWSMGSNYGRMTGRATHSQICCWYERAAKCASRVREASLQLLEGPKAVQDDEVKEWIELLLLDNIVDSEYVLEEEDDEEEPPEEVETKEDEGNGYFSPSRVEAISRFMASMLLSTTGNHNKALEHLKHMDLTHRVHPNVWNNVYASDEQSHLANNDPVVYPRQALPPRLYQRLCQVFDPEARYWKESDYSHRGYFSYFINLPSDIDRWKPSNLIEDVIVCHLLPRAKQTLQEQQIHDSIVGVEWWVHTRPIQSNLGHNLHFDTDEALLAQEGKVTHPILSSVLYLTGGGGNAGSTIVLNQTPDSNEVSKSCWTCCPQDNSFMLFNGNLLHGVLPCPGSKRMESATVENKLAFQRAKDSGPSIHRLTFMVGFWTRNVPAKMKRRKLYGPCGPMPSDSDWAAEIARGYPCIAESCTATKLQPTTLPRILPAWETIEREDTEEPLLELSNVAKQIDHRFFVKDAPQCFRQSLFEDRGDEE